jgi:Uma2 family endonuclease
MSAQLLPRFTVEEYLAHDRAAEVRSEYYNGEILVMAGGTRRHSLILGNTFWELRNALKGKGCLVFSETRLAVDRTRHYTYPDVMVVCGAPSPAGDSNDVLDNPLIVVEILSPPTERADRGRKFAGCRAIGSVKEYVMVSQDEPRVEVYRRGAEGVWQYFEFLGVDSYLELESIGSRIPLAGVYENIDFGDE